jgi:hypothetical protein
MFPSFPCYKEGTGGRGQIEPGPPVIAIDSKAKFIYFSLQEFIQKRLSVHLQDDRAHGKWLLSYRDEQGNVGSS